ncbi:MAG: SMP-30/gluconolactonase/LRE family protein [Candidatus Binatia bacterium]
MREECIVTRYTSHDLWRGARAALLGIVALGLCGCFPGVKPNASDKLIELMWPEPPLKTRIKFVGNLTGEHELATGFNWKKDLTEFLAGTPTTETELANPMGIVVSADAQRVYVTDLPQQRVFVFDLANKSVKAWPAEQTKVAGPLGIALDADENVYVVDSTEKKVVVLNRDGKPVRTFTHPSFIRITGIAVDSKRGRIYVSDTSHQKSPEHKVRVFDLQGQYVKELGKGKGFEEGYLLFPTYLTVDDAGLVYVADSMNARVQAFDPDSGAVVRTYGQRGTAYGEFERPKGLALDTFGNLYVADSGWANVQIFNRKGQVLLYFAGRGRYPGLLNNPAGMAIDKNNRIYVADTQNFRLSVYQLVNTTADDSFETADQTPQGSAPGPVKASRDKQEAMVPGTVRSN